MEETGKGVASGGVGEHVHTTMPEEPRGGLPEEPTVSAGELQVAAAGLAEGWEMLPPGNYEVGLPQRLKELRAKLKSMLDAARARVVGKELTPPLELLESGRMLEAAIVSTESAAAALGRLPHVRLAPGGVLPRINHLAEVYLAAAGGIWSAGSLGAFLAEVQRGRALLFDEVQLLPQALKYAQLEYILDRAAETFAGETIPAIEASPFSAPLHSLRRLNQFEWRGLLESFLSFDGVLRQDPAGAFAGMEDETRNAYHVRVAELARRADLNEVETARMTLRMAEEAKVRGDEDGRRALRMRHVGYFLFAEGLPELKRRIGYHPAFAERMREYLLRHNESFYVLGIVTLSVVLMIPIIAPLVPYHNFWAVMGALVLALLPATQGAVELVNNLVTSLIKAEALPKLDYTKGVPEEATTLVVVPTLLLSEGQVEELFEDVEARYLSNEDPHVHFALLTDLPDTPTQPQPDERHALVQMAMRHTEDLNAKYAGGRGGAFLLLHRYRVFNARQGVWMGWERKRGKLLDLNKLLVGVFDGFPIKAGPLEALLKVRYVITLDSDTQLPRSTAARMIGTMAHPLNRAIVDPVRRVVVKGYGILQPRVGVSVSSASRSRLAAIYSGETGFDIYTRAVSDVYQDLFGEGIFTGKGIYDARVLHEVLDRRFPRNALLSHDLIEGAYVRAGLVTDIEVIDDYPSQYHAHTRRKHRWIRGDWQIMRWLLLRVPDETGRLVANPISFVSQWKILDNLRRSLVEPVTFLVLISGCFFLPGGARYWIGVTFALLLLPAVVQLCFDLLRAATGLSVVAIGGAVGAFLGSVSFSLINLTFLAHQMMLSVDAIVRTLIRSLYSGKKLLEWETAAEAERGGARTALDVYLQMSPVLAGVIAAALAVHHRRALLAMSPILLLWALAPLVARWLSSPPRLAEGPLRAADREFLAHQALLLWRYYADFGRVENHWLIPDNVEEKGKLQVRRLSPTNLGMLLNARQAACELGLMTLPEFAEATLGTLATYERLEKVRGHIFNWYEIETLEAVPPFTVSSVDSGNLAASLYTLHSGALELLRRPLLCVENFAGVERALFGDSVKVAEPRYLEEYVRLLFAAKGVLLGDARMQAETRRRIEALAGFVREYLPWLMPEYLELGGAVSGPVAALEHADRQMEEMAERLGVGTAGAGLGGLGAELLGRLGPAVERVRRLQEDLRRIAKSAHEAAEAMEYGFLFVEARQLLSIGYDGKTEEVHSACYDLLASEARIASFLAVAKGDIPQQAWFRLDRSHVLVKGQAALLSWTGTMFEYMMPALWMRTFPNTLLRNSLEAAVRIQQEHVRGMPWGISESGFAKTDELGRYGYQAWGIPKLALKYGAEDGPVISPYSTFLALPVLGAQAVANLRRMAGMGWTGEYGFYEAADYTEGGEPRLVRSWMAHHQGMSLLAVTNLLRGNVCQRWFHANPRVRAAELLLHERALSKETLRELGKGSGQAG